MKLVRAFHHDWASECARNKLRIYSTSDGCAVVLQRTRQFVKGRVRINLDVLNAQQQLVTAKHNLA